jgi:putative cell wall-binding protein
MKYCLVLLAATFLTLPAVAASSLQERQQVIDTLKSTPHCCVVDGRSDGPRQLRPLKDAVVWQKGVRIKPTGAVVVIADDDKAALALARKISKQFRADTVVAVKGGIDTWRDIVAAAQEPGMPATFVIPMNTCEQGKPLQILRSNRK